MKNNGNIRNINTGVLALAAAIALMAGGSGCAASGKPAPTPARTNIITLTNTVTETNYITVTLTNTAPAVTVPMATPTTANDNGHVVAAATPTNELAVAFYSPAGSSTTATNPPIGMVDGLPVLINNVSRKAVTLTLKRVAGRGSITLEVNNSSSQVVSLLGGQYSCTWRIKGRTEVAGSCTLTVSKGDPADLVVGQGTYSATLTLADE